METRDHENSTLSFLSEESTISPKNQLRERIKIEFYKTYDVMTGIRIAATLGGFFSMMILLVLYKNYCKPSKTLSEEQLNAAVTAAAEEEDRALQAALEATSFYTSLGKARQSIDNTNQVLLTPRFSSVGGGYSHLTPPLKVSVMQQRGKSLPGSVLQFGTSWSPSPMLLKKNERITSCEDDLETYPADLLSCKNHLNLAPSRRVSSVTCSSADSAYLEKRCSFELGLGIPPLSHFNRQSNERLQGRKEEQWDYCYPIDIQVIQPTPEMSPSASEKNLNEDSIICGLQVPDAMHSLSVASYDIGRAPLASISSLGEFSQSSSTKSKAFNASTSSNVHVDPQGTNADDSVGSDSVFMDMNELETDSECEYDEFEDDYCSCELRQKPEMRTLKLASFDSYDASLTQEVTSIPEEDEEAECRSDGKEPEPKSPNRIPGKRFPGDLKRFGSLHEKSKARRKLTKTHSEPKSGNASPVLGSRIYNEKCFATRLSSLSSKTESEKKGSGSAFLHDPIPDSECQSQLPATVSSMNENAEGLTRFLHPPSPSSGPEKASHATDLQRSVSTSTSSPTQGLKSEFKPHQRSKQLSLPTMQEKRSRLQKQKSFMEDVKPINEKTDTEGLISEEE